MRKIPNEKIKQKRAMESKEGMDELIVLKKWIDKKDNLLVYDINVNDQCCFKTSSTQMEIASLMTNKNSHFLSQEYCVTL